MGTVAVKIKIMPESPNTNLEFIKKSTKQRIEKHGGVINSCIEEPIAFGLKSIITTMAWPEEKDTDIIENLVIEIKGVSSMEIIDYRRAIG